MNILFLTFYFEPDVGPGAFRTTALVRELAHQLGPGDTIHVVTTHPNRYQTYRPEADDCEDWTDGHCPVTIERIHVPTHNSGRMDQIRSFMVYYRSAHQRVRHRNYELVIASSSRLFTAFLAARIARKRQLPLFLDIRDLFREAVLDTLGSSLASIGLNPLLHAVERYTFGRATHINLVSEGFRSYFKAYPRATYSYFTNGIDDAFVGNTTAALPRPVGAPRILLYVGNIGEGQGLHKIIPQAAKQLGAAYHFLVIGSGSARHKLEEAIRREGVHTVTICDTMSRMALQEPYRQADYLFLHLNDLAACEKVLPSKLFEYGATDKPIVAGVAGYAASFIREHLTNYILFAPGDAADLARQLQETPYCTQTRTSFRRQFERTVINQAMAKEILKTARRQAAVTPDGSV